MEPQRAAPCPSVRAAHIGLLVAVIALLAFTLGVVIAGLTDLTSRLPIRVATLDSRRELALAPPVAPAVSEPAEPQGGIPEIVRRARPSVVTILAGQSQGSGVVWSADGTIVTVSHVVPVDGPVEVVFADGARLSGIVRARDRATDLAVIQVNDVRPGLKAAVFTSAPSQVGDLAVALGSPLGLENTVTAGIISAEQRAVWVDVPERILLEGLLQTDAPISKGDSGGALVNAAGAVVGLNEAYIPPTDGAVAIGFAIPSSVVTAVVDQLLRG